MSKHEDVWIKGIGQKRGAPRFFLDGMQAVRAGFAPGDAFEVVIGDGKHVVITRSADGSRQVSKRVRDGREMPVIDINGKEVLKLFEGMDRVRVVVAEDRVYLLPLASEIKKKERKHRLRTKLEQGMSLAVGSLSHGGGVLSSAIREGLAAGGIETHVALVNEIREDLVQHVLRRDAELGAEAEYAHARTLAVPMQEVFTDDWLMERLPKLEVLEMGLPCSGASKAGVAKRGLEKMEDHPDVGHLVVSALAILNKTQPAVVVLENVVDYSFSASASILRHQLRDMGYHCHEAVLDGKDFGCMEGRVRWCMVAVTEGVDFNFEQLAPAVRVVRRLGEMLDPSITETDPRWRSYAGLIDKAARDKEAGKGFKMQTISEDSTSVPTLRKGYHKAGTTDPLLRHPTEPGLFRLLTAAEHARVKGVPESKVEGLSETLAHQLLGQGIVYAPFVAVGQRIARQVAEFIQDRQLGGEDRPEGTGETRPRRYAQVG